MQEGWKVRLEYEKLMEHNKWQMEIPYLSFPADWSIKMTPPFAGAVVRFVVKKGDRQVSVYLDCYENLGCYGEPHWEIYPDQEGNNIRFAMLDTKSLLEEIAKSLA